MGACYIGGKNKELRMLEAKLLVFQAKVLRVKY